MEKLTETEGQIQDLLNLGHYEKARELLRENGEKISPVHKAIFASFIALSMKEEENAWEEIAKGLMADGKNYELYLMLGEYYASHNLQQSYLCYENALFYCQELEEQKEILKILETLEKQGVSVPRAAIIVLSYNLLGMTKECIKSIRQTIPESAREIIVVDNASDDGSLEWLKKQKDIKLLCNDENKGFPAGCNQGIKLADADSDIFLLNNDTLMMPNALFWLRMGLYEDEKNGSTGSVSNYASNWQSVIENGKTREEYLEFAADINVPMRKAYQNKVHLVGFSLLIKRLVLNKIGLLDERFSPGNYEDNDICLRITLAGYRNVLCRNSFIIHWGSKSFAKNPQSYGGLIGKNQKKFFEKWEEIGLKPSAYLNVRTDITGLLKSLRLRNETIAVIGTDDGAILSHLQGQFPEAQIFGVEQQGFMAKLSDAISDTVWTKLDEWHSGELLETFDVIIVNDALEDTQNPEKVLKEISKMLKKDGRMILSFRNRNHYSCIQNLSATEKLLSREKVEKMLLTLKLTEDKWIYTKVRSTREDFNRLLLKIREQHPEVCEEELNAYQWIVVSRPQRDDLCFGNKMAVCIPTYEHPDVIEDVLSHCAETYKRYGLDVYYYDSSRDERTKRVIERYQKNGYDNLYCIKLDSELQVYEKEEKIFQLEGLQKKYMYLWLIADRRWCKENTLQLVYKAINEKHDLVFLDIGHSNCAKEYSICNNANEFYHRCGDYATSMDTAIYCVDSMLRFDINEFEKKHRKGMLSFFHFQVIFEQLAKKKEPNICLLAGVDVTIYHSIKGSSAWGDKRIDIWGKQWIGANKELPDCYDNKEDVIKHTASFPWLLGSKESLVELHQKGILTPEYYQEIKDWWEKVSPIPLKTLKQIAYGEYPPKDVEEKQKLCVQKLGKIFSDVNEEKLLFEKVRLEEVQELVLQAAQYSDIGEKKQETLKDMLGAIEKLGEKEVQTKEKMQLILYIYMGVLRLVQK